MAMCVQTLVRMTGVARTFLFLSPPNSKCLHLLMASILLDLQLGSTHSSLNTIFFVVLAWKRDNTQNQGLICHTNTRLNSNKQHETYLLSENRLCLTAVTALLPVVSPLTCRRNMDQHHMTILLIYSDGQQHRCEERHPPCA